MQYVEIHLAEKKKRGQKGGHEEKRKENYNDSVLFLRVFGIIQFSLNHLRIAHYTYAEYTAEFDRKTLVWFNFVALCFCCISR